mgnify:CR=1 FL=1
MPTRPEVFVSDRAIGPDNTWLQFHHGERADWTLHPTNQGPPAVITSNRLRNTSSGTVTYYATNVPAIADYDVEADFNIQSIIGGGHPSAARLLGRLSPTAFTCYYLNFDGNNAALNVQLWKSVAGSLTSLGSATITATAGQTKRFRLSMRGSLLTCYVDDVVLIQLIDTTITAAGYAGLQLAENTTSTTGTHVTNFWASVPVSDDRFVDSDGTLLTTHTMNYGGPWISESGGLFQIDNNRARTQNTGNIGYAAVPTNVPSAADYEICAWLYVASNAGIWRLQGRNNLGNGDCYRVNYDGTNFQLFRQVSSVNTNLSGNIATSLTVGVTYYMRLSMRGTSIRMEKSGVVLFSATDSSVTAVGTQLIERDEASLSTTGYQFAGFSVAQPGAAGDQAPIAGTPVNGGPYMLRMF